MKPAPFEYTAPSSLSEALEIMAENGDEAKLLAGGQSLVPAMNFRLVQPTLLVDLNGLKDLDHIEADDNGRLRIGGLTRQRRIERDSRVAENAPLLAEAMPYIAHPQIRNRGTLGGSLAHADPAAELPVIAVALDASFRLLRAGGERWVDAGDFFQGIFTTELSPDEILVEVALPPLPAGTGCSFVEFSRRKGDYALLGVAAVLSLDGDGICHNARLVYLNAGEIPINAEIAASMLLNEKPSVELFREAAATATDQEIAPTGDIHASAPYLHHLATVLTQKALTAAMKRASRGV